MKGADLIPTISASLINATQLSFVEDAPGTRGVLEKLSALLRYAERKAGDVRFLEEWQILITYLELQRIQYPDRFSYETCDDGDIPGEFISRCLYLEPLNAEFNKTMEVSEGMVTFNLTIDKSAALEVELKIRTDNSERRLRW